MTSAEDLLGAIIDDVIATQTMSTKDWWAQNSEAPFVSMAIPAVRGREYRVTQTGVDAAHILTQQSWETRADLRQTIERKMFNRVSFTAIGEAIAGARAHLLEFNGEDPEGTQLSAAIAADYTANLERLALDIRGEAEFHIPCQLFDHDQGVAPFAIGPVGFLPRADWIARFVTDPRAADMIRAADRGEISADTLQKQALGQSSDGTVYRAWDALSFLRGYGWVATMRLSGHEAGQAQQKASILIGLAIDALGLRFHQGDATRLVKADRPYLAGEIRYATTPTGQVLRGSTAHRSGLGSASGKLAEKMVAERPFLDAAGAVLGNYVQARQTERAPHIVERWVNALYWVGEARREASDFMAVVHYGCALDGLTGAGGDIKRMTEFAEAALSRATGTASTAGGVTVAEAVRRVYAEGRNKLAHGEMPGLFEDLADVRRLGDDLLVHLFDRVTFDLADVINNSPAKLDIPSDHAIRGQIARLKQRP
jgi:hypothetical protein